MNLSLRSIVAVAAMIVAIAGCGTSAPVGAAQSIKTEAPLPGTLRTVDLGNRITLELVWIPPGEFRMGSPFGEPGRFIAEGRRHRVMLTHGFWMGKYAVTQEQWQRVMENNPSDRQGPRLPVNQVNWSDCQTFLMKLNQRLAPAGLMAALPTEAQWEYACRAGTQTRFHGGDSDADLARCGWFANNSGGQVHEVGLKAGNPWGLYDMHGNVWQWCQDWLEQYPKQPDPAIDPTGPDSGSERILRGGAWNSEADICRAAYRFSYPPGYRLLSAGLRIVATPVN